MHKLETYKSKLPQKIKNLWMEHIKTFELDNWENLYLLKKDVKYFILDKKWRNKFINQNWIHEDNEGISFHMEKDIDDTNYLAVELSWVTLYYSENWKNYKPKDKTELIKKSLADILLWAVKKLWLSYIFPNNTKKQNWVNNNNNIDYKK